MRSVGVVLAAIVLTAAGAAAQEEDAALLRAELAAFEFLAGSCWTGVFPGSETFDVHCYEPVLNGYYLRDVHAVPQGADVYRGETLYHWDAEGQRIVYRYYNSIGGVSDGEARPQGRRILFPDETYRGQDGVERVFSTIWEQTGPDGYNVITGEVVDGALNEPMTIEFHRISHQDADALIPGGL